MKHKQHIGLITLLMLLGLVLFTPASTYAERYGQNGGSGSGSVAGSGSGSGSGAGSSGGGCGLSVANDNCGTQDSDAAAAAGGTKDVKGCSSLTASAATKALGSGSCTNNPDLIALYLNPAINLFSGLVGVVVVTSIIAGGIQYSSSAGDPQRAAKARGRISNAIIALIAYAFLYMFLQFIIPGGLFKG
jgi:hypothetical protein